MKNDFFKRGGFILGNGQRVRFWEDTWLGDMSLADRYPSLFNIARRRNVIVADVLANVPLNIEFRRTLNGSKWSDWLHLVEELMGVTLSNEPDQFRWRLTPSGMFSVKSMYADLMNGQVPFRHKYIWKLKVPLKIRIFMWFLQKKVILTKDNLIRRRWTGSKQCVFCHSNETVEHIFISCPFARNI